MRAATLWGKKGLASRRAEHHQRRLQWMEQREKNEWAMPPLHRERRCWCHHHYIFYYIFMNSQSESCACSAASETFEDKAQVAWEWKIASQECFDLCALCQLAHETRLIIWSFNFISLKCYCQIEFSFCVEFKPVIVSFCLISSEKWDKSAKGNISSTTFYQSFGIKIQIVTNNGYISEFYQD